MLATRLTLAFTFCLSLATSALGQPATADARIDALIRKLGSSSFLQREQARKELEAIGTPTLERLRAVKSSDAETSRRIAELTRLFEEQLLIRQILAPKEITLSMKDLDVQQAIKELASLSGYPIQFFGDATKFADKKITIEGKLPFWQALDKLCAQAGLMERVDHMPSMLMPEEGKRIMRRPIPLPHPQPTASTGPIVLVNRGSEKSFVSYAGAIKTEVRISREAGTKELNLLFVISAEPRLVNYALVGPPNLEKALDDKGRKLTPSLDAEKGDPKSPEDQRLRELERLAAMGVDVGMHQNRRIARIRLGDDHAASQIKELAGKLLLQVDVQNEILAKLGKVMYSAGKSADGAGGGTLKLQSIKKNADGKIEAQVTLENLGHNPFGNNIIMNAGGGVIIQGNIQIQGGGGIVIGPGGVRVNGAGNGNLKDLPDLLDAKGQKFKLIGVSGDTFNFVNGSRSRTATVIYQPNPGQAEPNELVLFGTRTHTIGVPFRFEKLPLP